MPILVALTMYDVDDVCVELARRTSKQEPYRRQRVDFLIKRYLPTAQRIGNRYLLTEVEVGWLATKINLRKRASKY